MKLHVHVGLHRAASTALQNWLLERTEMLAGQGCFVHAGLASGHSPSPFSILIGDSKAAMDEKAIAQYLRAALHELQGFARGIVSDENLLGAMPRPGVAPFSGVKLLCRVFDQLGEEHEIVPVVVLRGHVAWLQSLHRTYETRGGDLGFPAFVAGCKAQHLRFAPILNELSGGGRRTVVVDSLEQIATDSGQRLLTAIGLAPGSGLALVNSSFGDVHRRITVALGRRHAMLAAHGGSRLHELLAVPDERNIDEIAGIIHDRAIRVAWNQTPAWRMNRAITLHRQGPPADRRLDLAACRDIALTALRDASPATNLSTLPLDAFAADRQTVAETWLPEWRTTEP